MIKRYIVERTNKAGIRLEEHNNSPDSDMSDLGDKGMAEGMDTITRHTFTKERQPQAVSDLSYHQPNQPSWQDHALSYPQPTQG